MLTEISRIRRRRAARLDQLELVLETIQDLTKSGLLHSDAATHIGAAVAEHRAQITQGGGFKFVQTDMSRMAQITRAIRNTKSARPMEALDVLHAVLDAVGWDDQWCTKTQEEIGQALKMKPGNVSRAFKTLSAPHVGALVGHRRTGRSWQWEIDATLASRLSNAARTAAAARQHRAAGGTRLSVVQNKEPATTWPEIPHR